MTLQEFELGMERVFKDADLPMMFKTILFKFGTGAFMAAEVEKEILQKDLDIDA